MNQRSSRTPPGAPFTSAAPAPSARADGPLGVVLIHGAWHDRHTWNAVLPLLESADIPAVAIDLPGAGETAARPASFNERPLDPARFGTEPSPSAGVTQDQRTKAAVAAVLEMNERTGSKTVVVGHSLGGLTVSQVVEAAPAEVAKSVYLSAFMLPPGMNAAQMIGDPAMENSLVPSLFMADPEQVGALRMDTGSTDKDYLAAVKATFFGDLTDAQFRAALAHLHPDEPAQVAGVPSPVTPVRFGAVSRHYIACSEDRAIPIAVQQDMIGRVDKAMGNETTVHRLETSHSPFHSAPDELAAILSAIAAG